MGIEKIESYDVIIAGAGLAGLTCALHLRKNGWKVLCVERDSFPRHKVCGEYVSNEVRDYLEVLGFNPKEYGSIDVKHFSMFSQNGKSLSHELKMGGFGLSRYTMDKALYDLAIAEGVHFLQDEVTAVKEDESSIVSTLSGQEIKCRLFISAAGKRSKIDKAQNREFMQKRTGWMGVKAHYKGTWSIDEVALYQFDGGYCGISSVEDGRINVCYLVQTSEFKKKGDFVVFERDVIGANPSFAAAMNGMERVMERKVISQIYFGNKEKSTGKVGYLGDAAGMIYPLAGNGMAMAIHSSKIYSELASGFLSGELTSEELSYRYEKEWKRYFQSRINKSRLIQNLMGSPILSKIAMNTLPHVPQLLSIIIEGTHGKKVTSNDLKQMYAKTS